MLISAAVKEDIFCEKWAAWSGVGVDRLLYNFICYLKPRAEVENGTEQKLDCA